MIKTILKFSVPNVFNLFFGLLSAVILTRLFDPDIYGILNIFNTTVATGLSILYLGLDSSYIRFYNEPPDNQDNKVLGTKLLLICLSVTTTVGLVISLFYYKEFSYSVFRFESKLICILVFISIATQIVLRFLNIKYRMDFNTKMFTIQSIMIQCTLKAFVVIAAILRLGFNGILVANVAGVFILAIIFLLIQKRQFFSFKCFTSYKGYQPVFLFAVFSAPIAICINLNTFLTQQIISHQLGLESVGIYASAGYFASILGALQGGFTTFWSAYMYANYEKKQKQIQQVNENLLLVIIIVYAGLILGKDIVYLLLGEQYQPSKEFFSMALSYPVFMLISETSTYGLSIKKKNHLSFICFLVSIILNLFLVYTFLPVFGLKGAALAAMISGVCLYILRTTIAQTLYCSISDLKITIIDIFILVTFGLIPSFVSNNIVSNGIVVLLTIVAVYYNRKRALFLLEYCGNTLRLC